ncbi:MAG: UDP-N-acetylmuramoylalanyl-D-glutamyl-2,6-diaminopimelate--D-alanyl-D-alanine ligase [Rhodobiaceae bacterium]|nr:UDP-N-acetylmuramoylalanyl-D-glutamyl-2,6-diaminopimelate--D-alanyl-D-alanine ligase [Rhodobiaceae bacterium]
MVDALWTIGELVEATGGELRCATPAAPIHGISIDSRTVTSGEAFFAIRGDRFDGHEFVDAALTARAGLAVVAADKLDTITGKGPLLVVPDVLGALEDVARAARARSKARIVAVTGSVGKTSTKEALRIALSPSGPTHASAASFNNHWGVPLSLARLDRDMPYAVFEIGMNHPGEITPLVAMVRPHAAIVTTVEAVHIEYFKSVEEIADAKAEIFTGLVPGGHAIINRDNPHYERLRRAAKKAGATIVSFGESRGAKARLEKVALNPACSCVSAKILGHPVTYKLGAPGKHLVMNSLAVLAAAEVLGADLALAALSLQRLEQPAGRGRRSMLDLRGGRATLIDESYNANPASMRAALALLGQSAPSGKGRRIAVMGDMLELGEQSDALHAALASDVAKAGVDLVFASGPHMRALADALPPGRLARHADRSDGLRSALLDAVSDGDVIMIKGSNGSRMAPLVEALCERYPPMQAEPAE